MCGRHMHAFHNTFFLKFEQYQHQRIYFDHQHRYLVSSVPRYVLDIQYSLIYSNTLYYILIQILLLSKKDRTGSRWKSLSRGPDPIDPAAHTICQAKGGEGPRGLAGRFEGIPRRDCGIYARVNMKFKCLCTCICICEFKIV